MKTVGVAALAASCLLAFPSVEAATNMDIASCEDLMAAASATSADDVVGTITSGEISCTEWTTLEIQQNRLKLIGDITTAYKFDNVRVAVGEDGVFRADVPIEFTGDNLPDVTLNGSVLNVEKGGTARFMAPVKMYDVQHQGGQSFGTCLYNEGTVRFEDEFTADACRNQAEAQGGCVWNGGDAGKMVFKGETLMSNCGNAAYDGGAVFNVAKMTFSEDAYFGSCEGNNGGGIWNGGEIKFLKNSEVKFDGNVADGRGGHIYNLGIFVFRNEVVFESGGSGGQGGALYFRPYYRFEPPRGVGMTFRKPVRFSNNQSGGDGGAVSIAYEYVEFLPKEATYSGNVNLGKGDDFWCDDIYIDWDGESEEDGYICAPCTAGDTTCARDTTGEISCGALTCADLTFE